MMTFITHLSSKAIIEELNRLANTVEGGKQTLTRIENSLKILIDEKELE